MCEMLFDRASNIEYGSVASGDKPDITRMQSAGSEDEGADSEPEEDYSADGSGIVKPHAISFVDTRGRSSLHLVCENAMADVKLLQFCLDREWIKADWRRTMQPKPWYSHWEYGPRGSGYYLNNNGGTVPDRLWDGAGSGLGSDEPNTHPKCCGTQLLQLDDAGMTPMHLLCSAALSSSSGRQEMELKKRHVKMLEALCKACKTAAKMLDHSGRLPLHYFLANPGISPASFKVIAAVSGKSAYRQRDAWGSTPLHLMCWNPGATWKLLKTVLKGGAGVTCGDEDFEGRTPLHCLCEGPACTSDNIKLIFAA